MVGAARVAQRRRPLQPPGARAWRRQSLPWLALGMVLALGMAVGCEAAEEPGAVVETTRQLPPSAAPERPLTSDLVEAVFPALDGQDLVWAEVTRPAPDSEEVPADPPVDCLACPHCGTCAWRIQHRRLGVEGTETLATLEGLRGAPRAGGRVAVWLSGDGGFGAVGLDTGERYSLSGNELGYLYATPVPSTGALWWVGYDSRAGQNGVLRYDLGSRTYTMAAPLWIGSVWSATSVGLGSTSARQPLDVIDGQSVLFTQQSSTNAWEVMRLAVGSEPTRWFAEADTSLTRAVVAGSLRDSVVTLDLPLPATCPGGVCPLQLSLRGPNGQVRRLTDAAARPTRYLAPVVAGDRVYWIDARDGAYDLWSAPLDGEGGATRITSDEAVLSAWAPPAISSSDRVVWMDRRSGGWRLYTR